MRQRYIDDLSASIAQHLLAAFPALLNLGVHTVHPVFARDANALALKVSVKRALPIGHRQIEAGRIFGVKARHCAQHNRAIGNVLRHWPCLIERACKGDHAPAAAPAIGRLKASDARKGRWLPDRTASVGAGRSRSEAC